MACGRGEERVGRPAAAGRSAEALRDRAERGVAALGSCRLCPRDCGVDRLADERGVCRTGRWAVVVSAFPHHGEEDCLRGWRGSGTIFFGHCHLRCVFCQNYEISQPPVGRPLAEAMSVGRLADSMLRLQDSGCHNINLVSAGHVVAQVIEALGAAVERGLDLPIVYNTSAYEKLESLALLDGLVDIYMPDFKLWTTASSRRYLAAADYPERARAAIAEMHRQVGDLVIDGDGLAWRGVLVRHLVMPGLLGETACILSWIAKELGPGTYVNLMDQYAPAGRVGGGRYAEIDRGLEPGEFRSAVRTARQVGLRRLDGVRSW